MTTDESKITFERIVLQLSLGTFDDKFEISAVERDLLSFNPRRHEQYDLPMPLSYLFKNLRKFLADNNLRL